MGMYRQHLQLKRAEYGIDARRVRKMTQNALATHQSERRTFHQLRQQCAVVHPHGLQARYASEPNAAEQIKYRNERLGPKWVALQQS